MKKIINLHFESTFRGPGRVVENLARGLNSIGFEVHANDLPRPTIMQGCLQVTKMINALGRDTLMGPNLFVLPREWGKYCKRFDHYVVPSEWVVGTYRSFDVLDHATIDIWPVGIDTEMWNKETVTKSGKVLVYFKNREQADLDFVTRMLDSRRIDYEILKYGSYEEKDLYRSCVSCDSCILITGTESQGIAYMQILSMGLPCFVFNKTKFDYFEEFKENPPAATSVPYFDERCGEHFENFDIDKFENFRSRIKMMHPRDYIIENFTLEKGAENYVSILTKYL